MNQQFNLKTSEFPVLSLLTRLLPSPGAIPLAIAFWLRLEAPGLKFKAFMAAIIPVLLGAMVALLIILLLELFRRPNPGTVFCFLGGLR